MNRSSRETSGTHHLSQIQRLKIPLDEAWIFLSDPRNLKHITPRALDFRIHGEPPRAIEVGARIAYTVTPMFGWQVKWETLIEKVEPPHHFVDVQAKGPYSLWRHEHFLKAIPGGVEMKDHVTYRLPFHPFSAWAHPLLVKPRLKTIFEYRRQVLSKRFGEID
jgi:ligand-binding SRPBCC domain-containing protein